MSTPEKRTASVAPVQRARWQYFAQRVVYPWELPSIMRKHIYTGAMGATYGNLISGIIFIYFGNVIGLTRFQWGLMAALSSVLLAAQVISAVITQRLGHRKFIWFVAALVARILRTAGILVAAWLWYANRPNAAVVLIGSVVVANFFDAMSAPPWLSWLADIIPEEDHGGFWGRRAAWISFVLMFVVVPAGWLLDLMPTQELKLDLAMRIFIWAGIVGVADLFIHGTIPEPEMARPKPQPLFPQLMEPLRDKGFRPWIRFNFWWTASMTLGGALSWNYFVEELDIKSHFLGGSIVTIVLGLVGGIMTGAWTGKLVDKLGPQRGLYWGHMFWAMLPVFWIFPKPGHSALFWIGVSSVIGGAASTTAMIASNKVVTRFPPDDKRAMYVAVSSCVGSLAGGLGAFAAGTILKLAGTWSVQILGRPFGGFQILFLSSLILRYVSALTLIRRIDNRLVGAAMDRPLRKSERLAIFKRFPPVWGLRLAYSSVRGMVRRLRPAPPCDRS